MPGKAMLLVQCRSLGMSHVGRWRRKLQARGRAMPGNSREDLAIYQRRFKVHSVEKWKGSICGPRNTLWG